MTKTVGVKFPVNKVYPSMLEHLLAQPDLKVKRCLEPSLIEADVGWTRRLPPRHVPIIMKIEILPKNEGSRVRLSFDFSGYWLRELPWIILLWVPLILFSVWVKKYFEFSIGLPILILVVTYFRINIQKRKEFLEIFTGFLQGL